jgi:hypothetical protein
LGPRPWKENRNRRDYDDTAFVKDPVAHGERTDDADPNLAGLLRQIGERLSELRVEAQPSVEFFHCCQKRLAVASRPGNVSQGQ